MTLTEALAAALTEAGAVPSCFIPTPDCPQGEEFCGVCENQEPESAADLAAAILADPAFREALTYEVAEALHDLTPLDEDGGMLDVCNRWSEHETNAAAIVAHLLPEDTP